MGKLSWKSRTRSRDSRRLGEKAADGLSGVKNIISAGFHKLYNYIGPCTEPGFAEFAAERRKAADAKASAGLAAAAAAAAAVAVAAAEFDNSDAYAGMS